MDKKTSNTVNKTMVVNKEKKNSNKKKNNNKRNVSKKDIKKNNTKNIGKLSIFNKRKKKKSNIFVKKIKVDIFDVLLIIVFTAIICCFSTGYIMNYQYKKNRSVNETLLYSDSFTKFVNVYNEVMDNYYEEVDEDELADAALDGMMSYLGDKYSIYLSGEESDDLAASLDGSYEGIGIVSSFNEIIYVYNNSPAEVAGLKVGDIILEINDVTVTEDNYIELYSNIKDSSKANKFVIKRGEDTLEFEISNKKIDLNSVASKVLEKNNKKIGYIVVTSFSSNTYSQFVNNLNDLEDSDIDSLIIDLRDNGGGYLDTSYDIASLFLEKGSVIYNLETKDNTKSFKDTSKESRNYDIVILINGDTASASEVLTCALKDSYGATIVGEKSFGKGKVQTYINYGDSVVKYTSAKWTRSNGDSIDGIGITPDYEIENTVKGTSVYDNQLEKAIELLS